MQLHSRRLITLHQPYMIPLISNNLDFRPVSGLIVPTVRFVGERQLDLATGKRRYPVSWANAAGMQADNTRIVASRTSLILRMLVFLFSYMLTRRTAYRKRPAGMITSYARMY